MLTENRVHLDKALEIFSAGLEVYRPERARALYKKSLVLSATGKEEELDFANKPQPCSRNATSELRKLARRSLKKIMMTLLLSGRAEGCTCGILCVRSEISIFKGRTTSNVLRSCTGVDNAQYTECNHDNYHGPELLQQFNALPVFTSGIFIVGMMVLSCRCTNVSCDGGRLQLA